MARRLKVKVSTSHYVANRIDGRRLRIEITDAEDMPAKVFAYLLMPMSPQTLTRVGEFDHVCSPVDLEEYPEDEPIPNHRPEWFRLNYVDVLLRSVTEIDAYLADVRADLQSLILTLNTADTLITVDEFWLTDAPDEAPETSSESSESSESSASSGSSESSEVLP